jgi:hypothetical protein
VESQVEIKKILLEKYQSNIQGDNVYKLVYELDSDFIEFEIIIPFINNLFEQIKLNKNIGISNYLRLIKILWSKFEFKNGHLSGTIKSKAFTGMINFIIFNVNNGSKIKSFSDDKSEWINLQKSESLISDETIIFPVSELKTSDLAIKEFYKSSNYFSKKMLISLSIAKETIENRKKNRSEKLFDLLIKNKT